MGRRYKGVSQIKRPVGPIDHPVSAIFDEPHFGPLGAVVRWWYGDMFHDMRAVTPGPGFVEWCKERVRMEDLETMERKVWGDRDPADAYATQHGPEFWKMVVETRSAKGE
jgi:hypothetical protein